MKMISGGKLLLVSGDKCYRKPQEGNWRIGTDVREVKVYGLINKRPPKVRVGEGEVTQIEASTERGGKQTRKDTKKYRVRSTKRFLSDSDSEGWTKIRTSRGFDVYLHMANVGDFTRPRVI